MCRHSEVAVSPPFGSNFNLHSRHSINTNQLKSIRSELQGTLRILDNHINNKRPILTLPVELLACIFEQLLFVEPETVDHSFGWVWKPLFKDSTALLAVSQTCHRLREVALSRSGWWAHLSGIGRTNIGGRRRLLPHAVPDLFITRSEASPIVVAMTPDPMDVDYGLDFFGSNAVSRIEEFHLLHSSQWLVEFLEGILNVPAHRPHLKALTCGYRPSNPRRKRPIPLYHDQLSFLQHLCLGGVSFRLPDAPQRRPFPSITNLILSRISSSNTLADIESLLRLCPNLRSVVLAPFYLFDPDAIPQTATPLPTPSSLRRLILHDVNTRAFGFFLSLFPPDHPFALQLLTDRPTPTSFQYKSALNARLHGKPTHLRFSVVPASSSDMGAGYRLSVTLATDRIAIRIASFVAKHPRSVDSGSDVWLKNLLSDSDSDDDPLDLSEVREAWLMKVTPARRAVADLGRFHEDIMAALRRMPLLDTIVLVAIYRSHRIHGPQIVYAPNLSILPGVPVGTTSLRTSRPTTLRLAYYDASPRNAPPGAPRPVPHDPAENANESTTEYPSSACWTSSRLGRTVTAAASGTSSCSCRRGSRSTTRRPPWDGWGGTSGRSLWSGSRRCRRCLSRRAASSRTRGRVGAIRGRTAFEWVVRGASGTSSLERCVAVCVWSDT